MKLSKIHELLETDHLELDALIGETEAAIEAADATKTFETLDYFWARLGMHIRAEHLRLFPAVREVAAASSDLENIPEILTVLREDHDYFMTELARAIKALRLVFSFGNEGETLVVVREILDGVVSRLKVHNEIEEHQIYTLTTDAALDPMAADELFLSIRGELERYPARFRGLAGTPDRQPRGQ
ncbi:MAG: hemerythrin domain-containing protein [Acidobacteria bacterium]|nr:hemerythrin domain-containing protein [Acidobacteriota bacterium]